MPAPGPYRHSFIVREALRVAPARPNVAAGVRAAIAVTAPLLLARWIARPELAFAGIAGFGVVLSDKGGAYRVRALSMLTVTVTSALATLLGVLAAPYPWLGVPLVLCVVGLGGFVRIFGVEATSIGTVTSVVLVLALARPAPELASALFSVGFSLAGGAWAALISLVFWPLRVYRPPRFAIARALRALARVAESFVGASDDPSAQRARREQLGRTREAIEAARAALGSSRRARLGPSRRGEQLVALLEATDLLFGALVALEDSLALERASAHAPRAVELAASALEEVANLTALALAQAATALELERPLTACAVPSALRGELERMAQVSPEHAPRILLRSLERLEHTQALARAIDDPDAPRRATRADVSELSSDASARSLLRDHLTLDSAVFRHALRMGPCVALVSLAMHALHVDHGYWATLTCLVIMQPHGAATWAKALQRVLGTVLGAGLAMAIASFAHDPRILLACVFAFVTVAMAVMPLNYGAYAVFLTPAFVLLAETHAGDFGLAWVRILDTLFGALVALLGSRLLFPLSERDQFRPLIAGAVAALRALLAVAATARPGVSALRAARRRLGLALLNAEASYQRLLTETGLALDESEALLTLLLYVHRIASGLIALAEAEGTSAQRALIAHGRELDRGLGALHDAIVTRSLVSESARRADERELDRVDVLFEQLDVLRGALTRWNARASSA